MIDWKKERVMVKILIDSGGIIYSSTMGNKVLDENNNPIKEDNKFKYTEKTVEEACYHADNMLLQLFTTLQCTHYLGFVDTEFLNSFRRKLNPQYKANRDDRSSPKWLKEVKNHLIQEWGFIPSKGYIEADDMVRIYANHYKDENIIIQSSDKDLLNLPFLTYNGRTGTLQQNTEEHYKNFFWTQMVTGDSADNVKALPRKGEKYAQKLFLENQDKNIEEVIFREYLSIFGENKGIEEFYKTYKSLHIVESLNELPEEHRLEIQEFRQIPGQF